MIQMTQDIRLRTDNRQTKEEFLSQFSAAAEEMVIKIQWAWEKGNSRFTSFGKNEELVHIRYMQPWETDEEHPYGTGGSIYWFSRRKLLGYPYTPHFIRNECYRVRVRKYLGEGNFFVLEEVLESRLDISGDDDIYRKVVKRCRERFTGEEKDVLIYCAKDCDVSKTKRADGNALGYAYVDYSAVMDEADKEIKMVGRCMTIPFDDREFSANRNLKFKAGRNYRIRVDTGRDNPSLLALNQLLEADVNNEALSKAGRESLQPVKWPVKGIGDFDIYWDRISMKASREDINWDERYSVSVYLECDEDNCHTAYRTTERFLDIYQNRKAFDQKIFEAVADHLADENGMVETWDEDTGTITRDEMLKRLTLEFLSFEKDGIDIMVGLDDLFTDHAFSLYMNTDGSITLNGLWG